MNKPSAEKTRNSFAKGLYRNLFRQIVSDLQGEGGINHQMLHIGVLDIPGFGKFISLTLLQSSSFQ